MPDKSNEKRKEKRLTFKEIDPKKYVDVTPTVTEAVKGTAVLAWGRMNPMTSGHEKLVNKVITTAKSEKGTPHVFLTHSMDKKKNPLAYNDKIKYSQKAFGNVIKKSTAKTIFELLKQINTSFNKVVLVAGSDRVKEFTDLLNKYNGKEYNFDEIKVVSAGDRDPDADGAKGMSASKMRAAASQDDFKKFKTGLPRKLQGDAQDVYDMVRSGMKLAEEEEIHINDLETLDEALSRQARRKMAITMRRNKSKIKIGREKAKRRRKDTSKLEAIAKRKARIMMQNKFAKHKRYADMDPAEKERIEKKVAKVPKERMARIARKLLIQVKKDERERFSKMATDNPQTPQRESYDDIQENPIVRALPKLGKGARSLFKNRKAIRRGIRIARAAGPVAAVGTAASAAYGVGKAINTTGKAVGYVAGKTANVVDKVKNRNKRESFKSFIENKAKAQDPDIKDMPGSQPKEYYKGVEKDKKDDRDRHFKKNAAKSDSDKSAYKPAPGDKEAKTKESKHTKKFKDMFGEENLNELWGQRVLNKPHMLMDKNNKVKFDKRFKMYKNSAEQTAPLEESMLIDMEIQDLLESTEAFIDDLHEDASKGLKAKAEKSGMPYGILKKVYDRGMAAWKGGHRPGTTPQQWGMARVNSFVTKSSGTWGKADSDLADKVRKEDVVGDEGDYEKDRRKAIKKAVDAKPSLDEKVSAFLEERGAGEEGTDELVKKFKKDTPNA